jgi:uncharacterized protein
MRGCRLGFCLMVFICWTSAAVGATGTGSEQTPHTVEQMHNESSTELLMRMNTTAEEDYQAGIIAYDRQEMIEAQELFQRAANKGHTGAMVAYASILLDSGFVGDAVAMYRKAAELGDPEGQFKLGAMYLDLGNYNWKSLNSKVNLIEARKWILKSADQNFGDAVNVIALAYAQGGLGLTDAERTGPEVLKWLNKSAEAGNGEAMDMLSEAYREGKYGLAVDNKIADEWAAKARIAYGMKEQEIKKKRKARL